jgi:alkylhydroperoxidase family enzyme
MPAPATPRIAPLQPPYPPEVQADFDRIMRGAPPLAIFRTVARNPRVLSRLIAGGLLDPGSITLRQRELVILRSCALCGAEYEWGVHAAVYGAKAGLTPLEIAATGCGRAAASTWSADEQLLLRLCEALHGSANVDDALWAELRAAFREDQLIELVMLCGLYHAVSFVVNALRIEREPFAPRFAAA